MTTKERISQLDSYLAQHRGLLSAADERRYIELVAECYNRTDDDEAQNIPLELLKLNKILQLKVYDTSTAVNSFSLNGSSMWIDYNLRNDYTLKVQSAKRKGIETVAFLGHEIPVDTAMEMLDAVDIYAMRCTGVTESHAAAILALQAEADVEAYDFTTGYPDKLSF